MNEESKKILLKTAKEAIEAAINRRQIKKIKSDNPEINMHSGCFVTLKNNEQLRGCLGQFTSDKPLIELITEMAQASATNDPRFLEDPISPAELKDIDIEISVLSPLQRTNNPLSLRLGNDGIYIKRGYASGCFLPQVAEEMSWSREEFLSYCCSHKAGLPADAWKKSDTEVYLFSAEVFGMHFKDI
jgi:uncharacterized protein